MYFFNVTDMVKPEVNGSLEWKHAVWFLSVNEYLLCTHCMPGTRLGTWHPGIFKQVSPFKEIINSHREFVHYSLDLWLQGNESAILIRDLGKPGTSHLPDAFLSLSPFKGPLLVTDARTGAAWQSSVRRVWSSWVYLRLKKYGIEMGGGE